jgi:DNA-binding winged helix-turn-helix (wHTH) protein
MAQIGVVSQKKHLADCLRSAFAQHDSYSIVELSTPEECPVDIIIIEGDNTFVSSSPSIFIFDNKPQSLHSLPELYFIKPLAIAELVVMIEKTLRGELGHSFISLGEYKYYPNRRQISIQDSNKTVELTELENRMILYLAKHPGNMIRKEELLEQVWGYTEHAITGGVETHVVETHIYRVRQKLETIGATHLIVNEEGRYGLKIS